MRTSLFTSIEMTKLTLLTALLPAEDPNERQEAPSHLES